MNLKFMRCDNERADNHQTICFRKKKKKIDVSFSSVCSVVDINEFRHNIVKEVKGPLGYRLMINKRPAHEKLSSRQRAR